MPTGNTPNSRAGPSPTCNALLGEELAGYLSCRGERGKSVIGSAAPEAESSTRVSHRSSGSARNNSSNNNSDTVEKVYKPVRDSRRHRPQRNEGVSENAGIKRVKKIRVRRRKGE